MVWYTQPIPETRKVRTTEESQYHLRGSEHGDWHNELYIEITLNKIHLLLDIRGSVQGFMETIVHKTTVSRKRAHQNQMPIKHVICT